jgi:hypothetical protein
VRDAIQDSDSVSIIARVMAESVQSRLEPIPTTTQAFHQQYCRGSNSRHSRLARKSQFIIGFVLWKSTLSYSCVVMENLILIVLEHTVLLTTIVIQIAQIQHFIILQFFLNKIQLPLRIWTTQWIWYENQSYVFWITSCIFEKILQFDIFCNGG